MDLCGLAFSTKNEKKLIYVEADKPHNLVDSFKREKESGPFEEQVKLDWKEVMKKILPLDKSLLDLRLEVHRLMFCGHSDHPLAICKHVYF